MDAILARYGELWLKSGWVKRQMQKMLAANISICLKRNKIKFDAIRTEQAGIVISTKDKKALKILKNVFGITSYSSVHVIEKDFDKIKEKALELYKRARKNSTFRVTAKRADKKFPIESQTLAAKIGAYIIQKTGAKVKMKNADVDVQVKISDRAYLYSEKILGAGGMPIGSQQRVLCIVRKKKELDACMKMMRRGCLVSIIRFGKCAIKKFEKEHYNCSEKLRVLKSKSRDEYAAAIDAAKEIGARAIVSTDSIKKMAEERQKHNFLMLNPII
ncbi:MAG: THUMP domain-containing protein [Candidatus Nanoarchaeia archaeon]|nr:THUMP domain-containing protein [Candidatus Nanoarchaeia archaeon]